MPNQPKFVRHKKVWTNCKKCDRPIHKDRGCLLCSAVEDKPLCSYMDILFYQFYSLKKTSEGYFQPQIPLNTTELKGDKI